MPPTPSNIHPPVENRRREVTHLPRPTRRPACESRTADLARLLGVDADVVAAALAQALEGSPLDRRSTRAAA